MNAGTAIVTSNLKDLKIAQTSLRLLVLTPAELVIRLATERLSFRLDILLIIMQDRTPEQTQTILNWRTQNRQTLRKNFQHQYIAYRLWYFRGVSHREEL